MRLVLLLTLHVSSLMQQLTIVLVQLLWTTYKNLCSCCCHFSCCRFVRPSPLILPPHEQQYYIFIYIYQCVSCSFHLQIGLVVSIIIIIIITIPLASSFLLNLLPNSMLYFSCLTNYFHKYTLLVNVFKTICCSSFSMPLTNWIKAMD